MTTDEQQASADTPRGRLLAGIAELVGTFEAETAQGQQQAAEERAALVHDVAAKYSPERKADELTLAEAGRIRRAWKVAEAATPRLIIEAHERDEMNATEIARELDCSTTYAARIIREHKTAAEK